MVKLGNSWDEILKDEFSKDYYLKLREFLKEEYSTRTIYPDMHNIFNALKKASYEDVKVVILGQDPYHEPGQAQGLCFSVPDGFPLPPSLKNIYQELADDLRVVRRSGNLEDWAEQGVLLLNAVLTVRRGQAGSHAGKGWEIFTDRVIELLNERPDPVIFLLWGGYARKKKALVTNPRHYVLEAAHPSPLSAYNGWFGCRHFSRANGILESLGKAPIDWKGRA
ncbi:MAG: uracil-DNA glycosylase [Firmicutes bacterium]|nr:uracil-DNA glycosylase [Bacillota bacterium]MBQ3931996.1 uracil-DNA glycosylase [Bacillota bacterium]